MKRSRVDDFYVDPKRPPRLKTPMDDLPRIVPPAQQRRDVTTSPSHDVTTSRRHKVTTSNSHDVVKSQSHDVTSVFDINEKGITHDTLRLTSKESRAIDQLVAECKWNYDLAISKNDVCRVALHVLLEDHAKQGSGSEAVARLRKKRQR